MHRILCEQRIMANEIVLYKPNEQFQLEVQLKDERVWLTQDQMALLFQRDKSVIARHISNIYAEGELQKESTVAKFAIVPKNRERLYEVTLYNLDVIISVGYRVKSQRGTQFRQWANKIIKDYLLRGYAVNQRLLAVEEQVDKSLKAHERRLEAVEEKIDFFVRTSLPPVEGIFYDGQIFDAYTFVNDRIREAKMRIVLIDNYVDDSVLKMLDKRTKGVSAKVYTKYFTPQLSLDFDKHNAQYEPIEVEQFDRSHDRFLCIGETVYHIGASLKDLGKKWFAFSRMEQTTTELLAKM